MQGVGIAEIAQALNEMLRSGDKDAGKQLAALLTRFFLYEELPSDVIQQLAPLFKVRRRQAVGGQAEGRSTH